MFEILDSDWRCDEVATINTNSLKFEGMYPLVPVINKPWVFPRPANRADSSIHKPKTGVKGSTLVRHNIRVLLDSKWIQDGIIPGCDSVVMQIEDIVEHYVQYHTQKQELVLQIC